MTDFAKKKFLIIAGQPKAGTTSLFDWMAQHPEACPSTTKETRFFNNSDYPLPRSNGFNGDNISDYKSNFGVKEGGFYLEATPDYLFNDLSLNIASELPNARVVVIQRDPIDRIASAFRFYKQRGLIPKGTSLTEYVRIMSSLNSTKTTPVHLRVLEQCRKRYLERYKDAFGNRLLILKFKEILSEPEISYQRVCDHIDISALGATNFEKRNESRAARFHSASRVYYFIKPRVVYFLRRMKLQGLISILGAPNKVFESILSRNIVKPEFDAEAARLIEEFLRIEDDAQA